MKWIIGAFLTGFIGGQFSQDSSLKFGGYRLGVGSDGYALQNTSDWHVVSQGWFPWHTSILLGNGAQPPTWTSIGPGEGGDVWQHANQKDEAK